MGKSVVMSSRARIDQLSYVFINGAMGLKLLKLHGIETPALRQFINFVENNDRLELGKKSMAPTYISSFSDSLDTEYSSIREKIKLDKESSDLRADADLLLDHIQNMNRVLEGLSFATRKTLSYSG
jgi:hypothetical protein